MQIDYYLCGISSRIDFNFCSLVSEIIQSVLTTGLSGFFCGCSATLPLCVQSYCHLRDSFFALRCFNIMTSFRAVIKITRHKSQYPEQFTILFHFKTLFYLIPTGVEKKKLVVDTLMKTVDLHSERQMYDRDVFIRKFLSSNRNKNKKKYSISEDLLMYIYKLYIIGR